LTLGGRHADALRLYQVGPVGHSTGGDFAYSGQLTKNLSRAAAKRKIAVELREQGHTYAEIATTMGLSIGSVGKLLHDARKHAATKQRQASA